MQGLAPLIADLAIILGIASVAMIVFQKLRQPLVLGYLVAGMIVGPYTPPHLLITDVGAIQIIAQLGVIFLMFALGLEFSFHKLKRIGLSASITGLVEVVIMMVIGYFLGLALHWPRMESLFLGAALSISSTTIIIKAISDLKLKRAYFAELVFGVLVVEDLIAIVLLVVLSTLAFSDTSGIGHGLIVSTVLRLAVVVGGWFLIGYFLVPTLFRKWLKEASNELLIVVAVALCLGLVYLAEYFNYSVALGAFIMGSILAETHARERIEHLVYPLRDIFAAVFFVSVGMLIDPLQIWANINVVLLVAGVTIVGKVLASFVGAITSREHPATAMQIGFSMAQIGEFSFIIAGVGVALNLVGASFYPLIVAVSVITTFTTPYLIQFSTRGVHILEQYWAKKGTPFIIHREIKKPKAITLYLRSSVTRLLLNSIMVAILFRLSEYFLWPQLLSHIPQILFANGLIFIITYALIAPFLYAMAFSFKISSCPFNVEELWALRVLAFAAVLLELCLLVRGPNFIERFYIALGMYVLTLILKPLLSIIYAHFEKHLQGNLRREE